MQNPIGKSLSDFTSTTQLPYTPNADQLTWNEGSYTLTGKHLRTLYLRVMCMEMDQHKPPLTLPIGDCKVELEDLKQFDSKPMETVWIPLDNQPDPQLLDSLDIASKGQVLLSITLQNIKVKEKPDFFNRDSFGSTDSLL
jgi:hypothetical protein